MDTDRANSIRRHGKTARGQNELLKHLSGERLTLKQAVNAHCYDCTGFFADGKVDCGLKHCPLHPFMAYNENRLKKTNNRNMTDANKEKLQAGRRRQANA
jgi:hypothetical protein